MLQQVILALKKKYLYYYSIHYFTVGGLINIHATCSDFIQIHFLKHSSRINDDMSNNLFENDLQLLT